MKEYPKIETLFNRDPKTFKVTEEYRLKEFTIVPLWHITEKIHGTNIRVEWDGEQVRFGGRTEPNSNNIPKDLVTFLTATFTPEKLSEVFGDKNSLNERVVTLYGEGCGPGIQKGGGNYSSTKIFVLFYVLIGEYWLEPENIEDVANKLGILQAPIMGKAMTLDEIIELTRNGFNSPLAKQLTGVDHLSEGVIARTVPGLFTRYGKRLVFKLKTEDFAKPSCPACGMG